MHAASALTTARPAHLVAIGNVEGGTGKSTLAVDLACALAAAGSRTVLLDNDELGSAAAWAASGRLPVACVHRPLTDVAGLERWVAGLAELRARYELVVIDFPAGLPPALAFTLLTASLVLVPTSPDGVDFAAMRRMLRHIERARAERPDRPPVASA